MLISLPFPLLPRRTQGWLHDLCQISSSLNFSCGLQVKKAQLGIFESPFQSVFRLFTAEKIVGKKVCPGAPHKAGLTSRHPHSCLVPRCSVPLPVGSSLISLMGVGGLHCALHRTRMFTNTSLLFLWCACDVHTFSFPSLSSIDRSCVSPLHHPAQGLLCWVMNQPHRHKQMIGDLKGKRGKKPN